MLTTLMSDTTTMYNSSISIISSGNSKPDTTMYSNFLGIGNSTQAKPRAICDQIYLNVCYIVVDDGGFPYNQGWEKCKNLSMQLLILETEKELKFISQNFMSRSRFDIFENIYYICVYLLVL